MKRTVFLIVLVSVPLVMLRAAAPADPFTPYLDGKAPEILRELPADAADWFAVASDDRPVTVSGDLIQTPLNK